MIKIKFLTDDVQKIALAMKYWSYENGGFVFDLDDLLALHHNNSKRELAHSISTFATAWIEARNCSVCKGPLTADSRTDALAKLRDDKLNVCVQCAIRNQESEKKRIAQEKEAEVSRLAEREARKRALYKQQFNDLCTMTVNLEGIGDYLALCIGLLEYTLKNTWRGQRLSSSEVYQVFGWPESSLLRDLITRGVLRQDPYKMDYEHFKLSGDNTKLEPINLGAIKFQLPFKSQGGTVQKVFEEQVQGRLFGGGKEVRQFLSHVQASENTMYLLHLLKGHAISQPGALLERNSKLTLLAIASEALFLELGSSIPLSEAWRRTWVAYKRTLRAPWAGHSLERFHKVLVGNLREELSKPISSIHGAPAWKRACAPTPLYEYACVTLGFTDDCLAPLEGV